MSLGLSSEPHCVHPATLYWNSIPAITSCGIT